MGDGRRRRRRIHWERFPHHPAEKRKIFPTPCDGWHHGGGLCILSPFEAVSRPLKSAQGGEGGGGGKFD